MNPSYANTGTHTMTDATQWIEQTALVCDMNHLAVVSVTGDDFRPWLQGQVTNELSHLKSGSAAYTFIVSLKGRVLADAWVLDQGDAFYLVLDKQAVDAVMERLDRYIIMEDVDLAVTDLAVLTVQGPKAADVANGGWPVSRLGAPGVDLIVDEKDAPSRLQALSDACETIGGGLVTEGAWEQLRLARAIPRFGADFGDWTYPQETGLTARAVSFDKGCYVGQEPVVMLQHRGKPPKRLCQVRLAGETPELAIALVKRDEAEAGQQVQVEVPRGAASPSPATVVAVVELS